MHVHGQRWLQTSEIQSRRKTPSDRHLVKPLCYNLRTTAPPGPGELGFKIRAKSTVSCVRWSSALARLSRFRFTLKRSLNFLPSPSKLYLQGFSDLSE